MAQCGVKSIYCVCMFELYDTSCISVIKAKCNKSKSLSPQSLLAPHVPHFNYVLICIHTLLIHFLVIHTPTITSLRNDHE